MDEELQLNIFCGDFHLPSIDLESLIVATYCSLAGIKLKINQKNELYYSKLPSLNGDNINIVGAENIVQYLENRNYNSNLVKLSAKHKFDIFCLKNLLQTQLDPCLQYLLWYDEENYNANTGCWYARMCSFPFNFITPRLLRKQAIQKLENKFPVKILEDDNNQKLIEKKVFANACDALNTLSKKLKENKFILGDKPTTIDAYVFSYLALFRLPVKKEIIRGHIRSSVNLERYVENILKTNFMEYHSIGSTNPQSTLNDNYSTIKWSDVFFSGCVAAFIMVYYAFSSGIISTSDSDYEEEEPQPQQNQQEKEQENK